VKYCLGVDRDYSDLSELFDERNEAVKRMIRGLIEVERYLLLVVG
jgi:hypothetical protein